jgi:uncharacterized protein (DUF433 family)
VIPGRRATADHFQLTGATVARLPSSLISSPTMSSETQVIHSDPEILGGTPVFVGTRVPFKALVDYLGGGHPLSDFLEDFPSVPREQAVAALEQAKDLLIAHSAR